MPARADYGSALPATGGAIASVAEGSPADRAGLQASDRVLTVDAAELHDLLDWQWHTADAATVTLGVARADTAATVDIIVHREPGESWGLEFESAIFDTVHTCTNRCAFCFMAQLPKGMRRSLYLRDDDYRLSFLQGNFVSLTNLTDADVARIAEQALSPLYVSLHAVTPAVRDELVCAPEDRALERFDELLYAGIDVHVQIVLVPGVNDGQELETSLRWLAEREGVLSVGVVPLGWTSHQDRWTASYESPEASRAVIEQIRPWQNAMRERDGITWVHLADEFYLNAGVETPAADSYDGFPQYENGIGIVRSFLDDAALLAEEFAASAAALARPLAVVSGQLAAPILRSTLDQLGNPTIAVVEVPNGLFGGNVSVAGLLAGADIASALEATPPDALCLVPDSVFNADGVTLDDLTLDDLRNRSGRDVRLVSSDAAGLLDGLRAGATPASRKES
ncbi:MAG: DUF512 domain-containing protein [Coriobacteriales bacterium]|nr:DUF512 domain-containing protein [Coriobacteriales bacterium]